MNAIRNLIRSIRAHLTERRLKAAGVPTLAEFYAGQGR